MSQQPIAELDTHDLLEITQRIKERGTMDVALRVQNYLSTIMRGAKMNGDIQMVPLSPQVIEILERLRSLSHFSELVATTSTGSPCPGSIQAGLQSRPAWMDLT